MRNSGVALYGQRGNRSLRFLLLLLEPLGKALIRPGEEHADADAAHYPKKPEHERRGSNGMNPEQLVDAQAVRMDPAKDAEGVPANRNRSDHDSRTDPLSGIEPCYPTGLFRHARRLPMRPLSC